MSTCKLEMLVAGADRVPRTCPTCGISGVCRKGFKQQRSPDRGRPSNNEIDKMAAWLGVSALDLIDLKTGVTLLIPNHNRER